MHCISWGDLGHELVDFGSGPALELGGHLGAPIARGRSLTSVVLEPLTGAVGLRMALSRHCLERMKAGPVAAALVPLSRARWLQDVQ